MSITEKAGTLLPQNDSQLEQFTKAQAHIRAAAHIIDQLSVIETPQLSKEQRDSWRNLADEIRSMLWECYSNAQDLQSNYYIPLLPLENQ